MTDAINLDALPSHIQAQVRILRRWGNPAVYVRRTWGGTTWDYSNEPRTGWALVVGDGWPPKGFTLENGEWKRE